MLVPFAIAPASVQDGIPRDFDAIAWRCSTDLLERHERLIRVWQDIGLLIHDGESFPASKLYEAIDHLPEKLKGLWLAMLKVDAPLSGCRQWTGEMTPQAIDTLRQTVSVALLDDTIAFCEFEMDIEAGERFKELEPEPVVEICSMSSVDRSPTFRSAISRSSADIEEGDLYQSTWSSRFHPLAIAPIKIVSIVDRYALTRHFDPRSDDSGLERFLKLLDENASGPRYVSLFAAHPRRGPPNNQVPVDLDEVIRNLRGLWQDLPKRQVRELSIYIGTDEFFSKNARGRFILFGDHHVWVLDHALEIFEGSRAPYPCSAIFMTWEKASSYRDKVTKLAASKKYLKRYEAASR